MDWDISSKDQAFARFSYINQRGENEAPLGPVLDGGGGNGSLNVSGKQINYGNNSVLSETHIFSPHLVNEFRLAYVYGHFDILNPGYDTNSAATLGLGGVPSGPDFPDNGGLPTTTISGAVVLPVLALTHTDRKRRLKTSIRFSITSRGVWPITRCAWAFPSKAFAPARSSRLLRTRPTHTTDRSRQSLALRTRAAAWRTL